MLNIFIIHNIIKDNQKDIIIEYYSNLSMFLNIIIEDIYIEVI